MARRADPPPRPRGRPRLSEGEETVALYVRVPASSHAQYVAAAQGAALPLSEWARAILDRAARRAR